MTILLENLDLKNRVLRNGWVIYPVERGTVWASLQLEGAEMSTEQVLEAMWQLADACSVAWRQLAALRLGKRFRSAWLSEHLIHGGKSLAQLRRELRAPAPRGEDLDEPSRLLLH